MLYFKSTVVEIAFLSDIKTSTGVLSQMENLTTPVCLYGLLRHHSEGSVLGIGRVGTGGCVVDMPCTHSVLLQAAQPKTLSGSMRRPPTPVLLDLLYVSHISGEGCYLKIKV